LGDEKIYQGVPGGCNLTLSYVAASEGSYRGILPDDMEGIIERDWYYLFVKSEKGSTIRLDAVKWQAVYASLTIE
jgi:hypothetical protein